MVRRLGVLPLLAMAAQDEILGDSEGAGEGDGEGGGEGAASRGGGGAGGARASTGAAHGGSSGGAASKLVKRNGSAAAAEDEGRGDAAREARRAREAALLRDGFDFEAVGVGGLALALAAYHPLRHR